MAARDCRRHATTGVPDRPWEVPLRRNEARGTLANEKPGDARGRIESAHAEFDRLRNELPPDTPTTTPAERSAVLTRRSQALQRRYAY